jgi:uncharacterized damage-inducible protein DinB
MATNILTPAFLEELRREVPSTRKCLERITESSFKFKPHETSMEMQYVALLVAEIPQWIHYMINVGEIDFATYPRFEFKTNKELLAHFEDCLEKAEIALESADDSILDNKFTLKRDGKELYSSPLKVDIPTTLNHWVHHRGQLTVYMRMNGIEIPSIYGPSGDDNQF